MTSKPSIKVLFFASLKERLNVQSIQLPLTFATTDELKAMLVEKGGAWAEAFGSNQPILCAVNEEIVASDSRLGAGDEVAFFPPVTGG